jgi:dienelactone hydrolase
VPAIFGTQGANDAGAEDRYRGLLGVGRATARLHGDAELTSAPYALACHPSEEECMSEKAIEIGGDHVEGISLPIISVAPISLPVERRGAVLQLRISAPLDGAALPIILFSHGNGQLLHAYGPLANHWAAQGFVVIQPTHLDSRMVGLSQDDPRRPHLWRHREADLVHILGALPSVLAAVPGLSDRVDCDRIAVAGHSWGAQTASMLLGARHPDPDDGSVVDIRDERVKAGILLTIPGTGGANLRPFAAQRFPFMHPDFSGMTAPALIIADDADRGTMTVRGPEWWREAYDRRPAPKALFTLHGGEHSLGGIANYEARETTDERPRHVAAIQRLSTAFLWSVFRPDDGSWRSAIAEFASGLPEGWVEMQWTLARQAAVTSSPASAQWPRPRPSALTWRLRPCRRHQKPISSCSTAGSRRWTPRTRRPRPWRSRTGRSFSQAPMPRRWR